LATWTGHIGDASSISISFFTILLANPPFPGAGAEFSVATRSKSH